MPLSAWDRPAAIPIPSIDRKARRSIEFLEEVVVAVAECYYHLSYAVFGQPSAKSGTSPLKLLTQLRDASRLRRYGVKTEKTYIHWVKSTLMASLDSPSGARVFSPCERPFCRNELCANGSLP